MTSYDAAFYDMIRPGVQDSAAALVPILIDQLGEQRRVLDVGCGEGWWASAWADHGASVVGVDGGLIPSDKLAPGFEFAYRDLTNTTWTKGLGSTEGESKAFDLVSCLEVAEHLPAAVAEAFVADLCSLTDLVVFSAAIPGQGGVGHVNEQPPAYWADLFGSRGFTVSGALRWLIWDLPMIENWYRQNLLVAARFPEKYPQLMDPFRLLPVHVVHPVLFDARRAR